MTIRKTTPTISTPSGVIWKTISGKISSVCIINKNIDEYLLGCIADGLQQVVIIGAGFDTRAYQFEDLKENVKVFEVDHPVTQQVKVAKINEIFGAEITGIGSRSILGRCLQYLYFVRVEYLSYKLEIPQQIGNLR